MYWCVGHHACASTGHACQSCVINFEVVDRSDHHSRVIGTEDLWLGTPLTADAGSYRNSKGQPLCIIRSNVFLNKNLQIFKHVFKKVSCEFHAVAPLCRRKEPLLPVE